MNLCSVAYPTDGMVEAQVVTWHPGETGWFRGVQQLEKFQLLILTLRFAKGPSQRGRPHLNRLFLPCILSRPLNSSSRALRMTRQEKSSPISVMCMCMKRVEKLALRVLRLRAQLGKCGRLETTFQKPGLPPNSALVLSSSGLCSSSSLCSSGS